MIAATSRRLGVGVAAVVLALASTARAGNPLIPTVYSADPSAHVWPGDDRLWIYASNDTPGTNSHDTMVSYHVFSTRDLVNWVDYGVVLHLKDVKWATSHMWAIDCVYRHGKYYLVYCAKEKGDGIFRTGLATSARPEGPFVDIGFIKGVEQGQDPAVFVDGDNTPYLYWGAGGVCHGAQLADDLLSIVPGTTVELTKQLTNVYEGPWVHKYKAKYYLSYPGLPNQQWPENMYYATGDGPLGPFQFKGKYIATFPGQSGTNHGCIIEYKGKWYALHHSEWISGMSEVRSLMCDELTYQKNGDINPIVPSHEGVAIEGVVRAPSRVTVRLEAENGSAACGELRDTRVVTAVPGFSGSGYVEGFEGVGNSVTVMVQSAKSHAVRLKIRYRAEEDEKHKVILNHAFLLPDPISGYTSWEKLIKFPKTGDWSEIDLGTLELKEGDNTLQFYSGGGHILIDYFELKPAD